MDILVIFEHVGYFGPFWPFLESFDLFGEKILQMIHCGHLGHFEHIRYLVPFGIWDTFRTHWSLFEIWDILGTLGVKVRFGA